MRRLALLRHAKSSWDNTGLSDFERPLNKRGLSDAPRMGKLMSEKGVKPGAIVSSSAVRARTTAELAGKELGIRPDEIRLTDALYLASASEMLSALDELAANDQNAILVGHNPGISSLANRIADARIDHLPTAACFYIEAEINSWQELAGGTGHLVFFARPKTDLT
jgi:phosphohistidine phosphatase